MKSVLINIGILLGLLVICSLLGGVLVVLAFGLGWLLRLFLPFSPFEATLLSLIAYVTLGAIVWSFLRPPLPLPPLPVSESEDDWEEEEEVEEDETPKEPVLVYLPELRRRRTATRKDIPVVDPDARCPCGSGRKYKNCHGRRRVGEAER